MTNRKLATTPSKTGITDRPGRIGTNEPPLFKKGDFIVSSYRQEKNRCVVIIRLQHVYDVPTTSHFLYYGYDVGERRRTSILVKRSEQGKYWRVLA